MIVDPAAPDGLLETSRGTGSMIQRLRSGPLPGRRTPMGRRTLRHGLPALAVPARTRAVLMLKATAARALVAFVLRRSPCV